jgi:hypothetical protein
MIASSGQQVTRQPGDQDMNKSEQREVNKIIAYAPHLGADFAARALSALYRASMRNKAKTEMLSLAIAYGWNKSPDFII